MTSLTKSNTRLPNALLALVALIWGSGFVFTNYAVLSGMPPSLILALRFLIPVAVMAALFRQELAVASVDDFRYGAIAGGILFTAFLLQTYGIKYTSPSNNAFLTTTNVVMVPFISWILLKKSPGLRSVALAFLCFVGMAVLSWSPGVGLTFNLGDWLTLLCAFCYACHIAFLGLSDKRVGSAAVLNFTQLAVAGVLSTVVFVLFERRAFSPDSLKTGLLPVIYLGLFATGLAFFIQSWAQRRVPPTRTAVILSCEGMFGSVFSVLCGYDRLSLQLVAGGTVILLSVILIQIDLSAFIRRFRPTGPVAIPQKPATQKERDVSR